MKERWTIENWWKWVKQMFKIKRSIGNSENALPVQIVSAFVTDSLLRAFKHSSGFTSSLYEFVSSCQELSLVPRSRNSLIVPYPEHWKLFSSYSMTPVVLKVLYNVQLDGVFQCATRRLIASG